MYHFLSLLGIAARVVVVSYVSTYISLFDVNYLQQDFKELVTSREATAYVLTPEVTAKMHLYELDVFHRLPSHVGAFQCNSAN
jgi:hypothetical protein